MKKVLLSATFSVFAIAAFAQYPCVDQFTKIFANNGGGNCPKKDGQNASGRITLTFSYPAQEAPVIVNIYDLSNDPTTPMAGVSFQLFEFAADRRSATYCYYSESNLHLNQGTNDYRFTIRYASRSENLPPCDPEQIVLPVKLQSFSAARTDSKVNLTWITTTEENNRGFELQRMLGTGKWTTVAFIFSQADNGSSSHNLTYQYKDDNNYNGITQYRLLQVDLDGKVKYSDIRSVRGLTQASKTLVFPNPGFNGMVNVIFEDIGNHPRSLSLTDINGRTIKQWNNYADNSMQLQNLTPGIYQLHIYNKQTGIRTVEKIVIANK